MKRIPDKELEEAFLAEIIALEQETPSIDLIIKPHDAWIMLAFIQLGLRHPHARKTSTAERARQIARRLQNLIAKPGTAMEHVAERGWAGE